MRVMSFATLSLSIESYAWAFFFAFVLSCRFFFLVVVVFWTYQKLSEHLKSSLRSIYHSCHSSCSAAIPWVTYYQERTPLSLNRIKQTLMGEVECMHTLLRKGHAASYAAGTREHPCN